MSLSEFACNAKKERALPSVDQDDEIAASVWKQTMEEATAGALLGPFELSGIDESIALSLRFGIKQGGKIRCVDDCSRSGVIACCSTSESPRPRAIDVIASLSLSLGLAIVDTDGKALGCEVVRFEEGLSPMCSAS